MSQNRLNS